ncbi:glycosyltransferase [Vibrio breoganii]
MMKQLKSGKSNSSSPLIILIGANFKNFGGVERVTSELYTMLSKKYCVKVAVNKNEIDPDNIYLIEEDDLIQIDEYTLKGVSYFLSKITERYNDRKIVIISCWYSISVLLTIVKFKYSKIKIIASEHSDFYFATARWILMKAILYRFVNKVVVLTEKDRKIFRNLSIDATVIRNPINVDNKITKSNLKNNKIIFVGHLRKLKNVQTIVEAVNIASKQLRNESWIINIYGSGDEYRNIKNLVDYYELSDLIILEGHESNLEKIYNDAKYLILPSETECLPMVILESRLHDVIPIVSEYSASVHELVTNDDGVIFPVGDYQYLAEVLEKISENRLMFSFDNDRLTDFLPSYVLQKWEKVING